MNLQLDSHLPAQCRRPVCCHCYSSQPPHSSRNAKCLCMTKPIIMATLALHCNASRPHERLLAGYNGPVLMNHFPCTDGGEVVSSGYYTYRQFNIHSSTFCPHSLFMCFVWI
jgi:hypothetical protein